MNLILINSVDILLVMAAISIAWIAQTKTAAVTACEFVLFATCMNIVLLMGWTSPFIWLIFTVVCYLACYFHIICTSHSLIVTSFFIPMLYNLAMFYSWGNAQWVGGDYGVIDEYYEPVMSAVVALQLITTGAFGGLKDGFIRIWRNLDNTDSPYLRALGGASE